MARPKCYETAADKQRAYRLRKKGLPFVIEEVVVQTDVPRIEMTQDVKQAKIAELRGVIKAEEEKPTTEPSEAIETRSVKDVVGGIYRNDFGGVISKSAWEKLQRQKAHAKENNFEMDEYSQ